MVTNPGNRKPLWPGHSFMGPNPGNRNALWRSIKLGQKVVCFMGAHKARTKSGLLYGQQIECPSQKIGHYGRVAFA